MRGRRDRDQVRARVHPGGQAGGRDRGEPVGHVRQVAGVQEHMVGTGGPQLPEDPLRDHVAGCQLGQFVLADHEALAVRVDEVGTLAAQRLRHQRLLVDDGRTAEVQRRGVELDELDVGDHRTGPKRHRHSVAGGDHRVRGDREDLAHAAGRQYHRAGEHRTDTLLGTLAEHVQRHPAGPAGRVLEQVDHERMLDQPDPRVPPHRRMQRPLHLRPGRVAAGVHDPVRVVAAFPGQHEPAVRVPVELGTPAHQLPYPCRPLGDQHLDRRRIAQPDPGDQRVLGVCRRRVERVEHRGDTPLRPPGRTVVDVHLGHHGDVQSGLAQVQRGGEPGDAGADDDHVGVLRPARLRCAQPAGQRGQIHPASVRHGAPGSLRGVRYRAVFPRRYAPQSRQRRPPLRSVPPGRCAGSAIAPSSLVATLLSPDNAGPRCAQCHAGSGRVPRLRTVPCSGVSAEA